MCVWVVMDLNYLASLICCYCCCNTFNITVVYIYIYCLIADQSLLIFQSMHNFTVAAATIKCGFIKSEWVTHVAWLALRFELPLMFYCLLIAIWGRLVSSLWSFSRLAPTPVRWAFRLYEVVDFWALEPLAVLDILSEGAWRASLWWSLSFAWIPTRPWLPAEEPAVIVRGWEFDKFWFLLDRPADWGYALTAGELLMWPTAFSEVDDFLCKFSVC